MKFLILLMGLFISNSIDAQDSWKVLHNGKTILTTEDESPDKNVIGINKNELNKKNYFSVIYKEAVKQRGWKRSIIIFDEKENQLYIKESFTVKIENAVLAGLFKKSKVLHIYTTSLPQDPKLAAAVRIRRVHLATIRMI